MADRATGPLDEEVLRTVQSRLAADDRFAQVSFDPTPERIRTVVARHEPTLYPDVVDAARLDIRWHIGGDFSVHYVERHVDGETWEIRWDRHPEEVGHSHVHPPPDASEPTATELPEDYRELLAHVRTYVTERIESLCEQSTDS